MRPTFHPRPVNGPFGDPALFIPFFYENRALLFDMGDLGPLPSRDILKISHVFVTHTHMDHFIGFDMVLRIFLGRDKRLHLFGPPSFLSNLEGKLAGYTWNLVKNYNYPFSLIATEVYPHRLRTREYRCADGFEPQEHTKDIPFDGSLLVNNAFSVHAIHLDHHIPCLAFKLKERFHVNIMKDRLETLGLPAGSWLKDFKEALYEEKDMDSTFVVAYEESGNKNTRSFRLGDLVDAIARISSGQDIVYVMDAGYSSENANKIVTFAKNADQLFIESAFLDEDADVALQKRHLTAKQAGILARKAQVKNFTLMHFSPKYKHTPHLLTNEAQQAFEGEG